MLKVGDKVKCVDVKDVTRLVLGQEYIVTNDPMELSYCEMVKIQVGPSKVWYYSYRFIKVSDLEEDDLYV